MHYFGLFWTKISKPRVNFRAFGRKNKLLGNFEKIFKKFLMQIAKNIILACFCKIMNKRCVNFSRVWTKNTNCLEISRNVRKFSTDFFKNLLKCIMLAYFHKNLTNHLLLFRAIGRKILIVWKFFRKLWKFLQKIQAKNWIFSEFWKSCC